MNCQDIDRRKFIENSLTVGASALLGVGLLNSCKQNNAVLETGETVKLLSQNGEITEVDKAYVEKFLPQFQVSKHSTRQGIQGKKFVMVIDLSKCRNALKCKEACSKMHYLPQNKSFIRVNQMQAAETTSPYWMPLVCFHCDNPPCTKVCPVDATFKRSDGIVAIDNERCIGCRFCMVACPYSARMFNWGDELLEMTNEEFSEINPHEACSSHEKGTVEKCDFCPSMALKNELPDCVTACPNGVFYFGDENEDTVTNGDETLILSKFIRDKAAYRFMEDLGTKPRVYYIHPVDRLFPFEETLKTKSEV